MQKGRFTAATTTYNSISLATLKLGRNVMQHILFALIAKRDILQPDAICNAILIYTILPCYVLFQRLCQLINKPQRSLSSSQQCRQLCHRLYNVIHQVHKQDHRASGHSVSIQRQPRTHQENSQLRNDPCHCSYHPHHYLKPASGKLFRLQCAISLGKKPKNFLFRLEGLYYSKTTQAIR